MKDDNYVDKEYEEANERGVVARRWRSTFYWPWRIVSHYGLKRPYYPTSGKTAGGWNQN